MIATAEILKQDARGRVRVPVERRAALLEEFDQSGASAAEFARLAGIKYSTFAGWVLRRRKKRVALTASAANGVTNPVSGRAPVRLVEALVEGGHGRTRPVEGLLVELAGGSQLIVESPVQLQMAAELLALIAERARSRC